MAKRRDKKEQYLKTQAVERKKSFPCAKVHVTMHMKFCDENRVFLYSGEIDGLKTIRVT